MRRYLLYPPPLMFQRIVFGCAMIVLFFVDLEHHRLPNEITLPGIVVGFACSFFMPPGWLDSLIGILVGGGIALAAGHGCGFSSGTKKAWASAT